MQPKSYTPKEALREFPLTEESDGETENVE